VDKHDEGSVTSTIKQKDEERTVVVRLGWERVRRRSAEMQRIAHSFVRGNNGGL
jgi:hypothetical protein